MGDEDAFENKSDKKDEEKSDTHNNINEQVNKNDEEKRTPHGKPRNIAANYILF